MTPCCFSSCCFECLKSNLIPSHLHASNRAGVCPLPNCRESDILLQDLIPNHALNKASDWFIRQRIACEDQVILETNSRTDNKEQLDFYALGHELIEEAKDQAHSRQEKLTQKAVS